MNEPPRKPTPRTPLQSLINDLLALQLLFHDVFDFIAHGDALPVFIAADEDDFFVFGVTFYHFLIPILMSSFAGKLCLPYALSTFKIPHKSPHLALQFLQQSLRTFRFLKFVFQISGDTTFLLDDSGAFGVDGGWGGEGCALRGAVSDAGVPERGEVVGDVADAVGC